MGGRMKDLNTFQQYFVEEFYDDYREGYLTRREFIRRVAFITGSMAAAVSTMSMLGCSAAELPAPTDTIPPPEPAATQPPPAAPTPTTPPPEPTATSAPAPTEEPAASTEEPAVAALEPVPNAKSPLSVPEGDPALTTSE